MNICGPTHLVLDPLPKNFDVDRKKKERRSLSSNGLLPYVKESLVSRTIMASSLPGKKEH